MIEILTSSGEFEQKPNREVEQTLLPLFPEQLEEFRRIATPIEQLYLSHPDEDFSLRLRETLHEGELAYTATLKNRGTITDNGLDRLEIETEIDAKTYTYYKAQDHVILHKLRAEPYKNIAIDWFENGHVHMESEHPLSLLAFLEQHQLGKNFIDISGDRIADNELHAHLEYRRAHAGAEALVPPSELTPETISRDIWRHQLHNRFTVVTIAGRSGSGKSTVIQSIQEQLASNGIASIVLSTDDYHRGKSWLEHHNGGPWTQWDAPIVYNIEALQDDVEKLRCDKSIARRYFDFTAEEPVYDGLIDAAPVVLVEGIYARDASFDVLTSLRYELSTPLATCVGRRLLRDLQERPQFAEPSRSLRYILEQAEPQYQNVVD